MVTRRTCDPQRTPSGWPSRRSSTTPDTRTPTEESTPREEGRSHTRPATDTVPSPQVRSHLSNVTIASWSRETSSELYVLHRRSSRLRPLLSARRRPGPRRWLDDSVLRRPDPRHCRRRRRADPGQRLGYALLWLNLADHLGLLGLEDTWTSTTSSTSWITWTSRTFCLLASQSGTDRSDVAVTHNCNSGRRGGAKGHMLTPRRC